MKFLFTKRALNDYNALSEKLQVFVDKQLETLIRDIRYPSLMAKKYDEKRDICVMVNKMLK